MSDIAEGRYLAFDLGAESARAMVGTLADGRLNIEELHRFPSRNTEVLGTRYWDILYLFAEFREALRLYGLKYGPDLDGIGVDTWGVDFGFLGETGQLLANPVHYRDHRTDDVLEKAFLVMSREDIYRITGIQFMPLNTLYQFWMATQTQPDVLREAKTFLHMPDLLNYFLTGVKCSEYSIASTSQLLDVHKRTWSDELMEAFGLPRRIMPDIVEPGTRIGALCEDIAREAGLNPVNVFAPCCHDTGSAVAAIPGEGENWAFLSCGTWSLLGMELDRPYTSGKAFEYDFTNEGGLNKTIRFLKNVIGLWVLQECRASWARKGDTYDYAELTGMAREAAPFQSLIDVDDPIFINPEDMLEAIGEHCRSGGRKAPETVGATVRTVLEGLAMRYALVIEMLEEIVGRKIDRIHMAGGGIQNELLCQFAADATGRTVVAGPVEATAMGNLVAQAIADGKVAGIAEARAIVSRSTSPKVYEPEDVEAWQAQIEALKRI